MRKAGIRPDVITYNGAVQACGNDRQWETALELLAAMASAGVKADNVIYNAVMRYEAA